jgi:hypothetical protein
VTLHKANISPELRAALDRRGVDSVRVLLVQSGIGPSSAVYIDSVQTSASRAEVEDWLREMRAAAEAEQAKRHDQMMRVANRTLIIAVVAAIAGIVAAWPIVKGWLN